MDSQKKEQRITVSVGSDALEILRQRQHDLAKTGLKASLSSVAAQAIAHGLKNKAK